MKVKRTQRLGRGGWEVSTARSPLTRASLKVDLALKVTKKKKNKMKGFSRAAAKEVN